MKNSSESNPTNTMEKNAKSKSINLANSYDFTVAERLDLGFMLPTIQKGTYEMLTAYESILDKIKMNIEEIEEYEIKQKEDGRLVWNSEKARTKQVSLLDIEVMALADYLKKLNEKQELIKNFTNLYKHFALKNA